MTELNETPEIPVEGDSQGQADDSGQETKPQSSNWADDPEFRRIQSEKDRAVEQERRAREQAEQQARLLAGRLNAYERAVSEATPDEAEAVKLRVAIAAQADELQEYRTRDQRREFEDYYRREAELLEPGFSTHVEFSKALQADLQTGGNASVSRLLMKKEILKEMQVQTPQAAVPQESGEAMAKQSQPDGYVSPPAGVPAKRKGSAEEAERLDAEYLLLSKEWTKNKVKIAANRKQRQELEG